MEKNEHEIRDPIHVFIRLDNHERKVLDSRAVQRLRHIHQLGLTYLVYPGATHKRFEHSLGVMELASRVFDVITHRDNVECSIDEIRSENDRGYWKRVLRMAALCHDLGHLPFSHTAEEELLPSGWNHEQLTRKIIESDELQAIWKEAPPLLSEHIVKLTIGPRKAEGLDFSDWETILAEIITGDTFGVDRMDYLLRDSHHTGVAYGKFDHYRLIDTLRILEPPPSSGEQEASREPMLGVEEGGLQSAESLWLARYFMYSQVYLHRVRRIYDIHLRDFLKKWLRTGFFSTDFKKLLLTTDEEIISDLLSAGYKKRHQLYEEAKRIVQRQHFKVGYERNPDHAKKNSEAGRAVFEAAREKFGAEDVRHDRYIEDSPFPDFPVKRRDGQTVFSSSISSVFRNLPPLNIDYVFVNRNILPDFQIWLNNNIDNIIQSPREEEEDEQA
jgi:hypothetical protein